MAELELAPSQDGKISYSTRWLTVHVVFTSWFGRIPNYKVRKGLEFYLEGFVVFAKHKSQVRGYDTL